ncbi:MAG: PAS domain S-box protein [Promethearchaeota archaeon]
MKDSIISPEEKFRAIINNINEGYFEVDLKGNLVFFNNTLCRLTGFSKDELSGLNYKYLTDEENRKLIFKVFNSVYKTGKPLTDFQYKFKSKNGKDIVGETSIYLRYDSEGNRIGFYGLFRDITKKKEEEIRYKEDLEILVEKRTKELKESEEKFRTLTEQSFLGIAIIQDNLIKYVNNRLLKAFGFSVDEIMNWQPGEFLNYIHPDDRNFVAKQVRKKQLGEPNAINQYQFKGLKKSGDEIWLEVFSKTINYAGKPANFITILDITEKKLAEQNLKNFERKYRNILENIMEGYYETDLIGNLVYANLEYCKIMGYSKEEVIGKNYRLLYDKKSSEVLFNMFNQVYKTGIPRPPTGVAKLITKKNKLIYFEGSVDLLYDSKGNKIGFYGLVRDITKRKIAEEKLKESEEKFRTIAEQSFMSIIIIQDGIFKYFNERLPKVNGYSPEEIRNWKPYEFAKLIHPEDRDFVMDQAKKKEIGEKDVIAQYKYRMVRKDGEIRWIENFSKTINYKGRPADFIVSMDITEQMNAEQRLKNSEQQYRSTIDSIRDPIHVVDKDLKIILINNSIRKWLEILDIKEDIIGKKLNEIFAFLPEKVFDEYAQVFTTGKPLISEEANVIKGKIHYTESIKIPIFSDELVFQVITIIHDISDHKLAQQKLKRSERKYREAFNRSNFYKDLIAHDINNILQNILSSVELSSIYLNEEKDINELKRLLKISKEQVSRGANLISNVRKLSILEEAEISTHPIEAIEVLNQSIDFLLNNYQDKKINIDIENPYKTTIVKGNELLIEIFENILINAVKYNQNSPVEIKIKVSKIQKDNCDFVKFEFKDNGIGISDIDKEMIFQRAYSIDKTISGMGIGLSLVKKVLNMYKGQIWADDRIEGDYTKGSNFVVLIPEV